MAKRQVETIIPEEMEEVIQITDQIEQRDAQRLAALVELAQLRGATLDALMATLGIPPPLSAE